MKKIAILAAVLLVGLAVSAFAHSGPQVGGQPAEEEFVFSTLDPISHVEDETLSNPSEAYKGWWWVNLTNNTAASWSSVTINPGVGDLVAIVQGNGLEDEWGFIGNSIAVNKPALITYTGTRGTGSRLYDNGATGLLWGQAVVNFTTAVAPGQKVGFKIYTDNSYYQGPYATSYQMTLTPNAVPEPSSLFAMATGLVGFAGLIRRKRS